MTPDHRRTLDTAIGALVKRPKDDDYTLFVCWGGYTLWLMGIVPEMIQQDDGPPDPGHLKKAA